MGGFAGDNRQDPYNASNGEMGGGATYGMALGEYGVRGATVFMHENGHNMGAVNNDAPYASGAGHCREEWDVLCYDDDGPLVNQLGIVTHCGMPPSPYLRRGWFDCAYNDYYYAGIPPAGNYLYNHWNVGWCWNRFLSFYPYCTGDYKNYPGFYHK